MHANEATPHPLPPLRAKAFGSRPPPLDQRRYHQTLIDALGWADAQDGVDSVFVEETIRSYPYCVNGELWARVSPGVWLRQPKLGG